MRVGEREGERVTFGGWCLVECLVLCEFEHECGELEDDWSQQWSGQADQPAIAQLLLKKVGGVQGAVSNLGQSVGH